MDYEKIIGYGQDGITYLLRDKTCLKVYPFNSIDRDEIQERFQNGIELVEAGVKVPRPLEIVDVKLNVRDWPFTSLIKQLVSRGKLKDSFPGIRKEFIKGKSLGGRLFPSKDLASKIAELNYSVRNAGFVPQDLLLKNYVQTQEGEVYIIDIDDFIKPYRMPEPERETNVPTCTLGELLNLDSIF